MIQRRKRSVRAVLDYEDSEKVRATAVSKIGQNIKLDKKLFIIFRVTKRVTLASLSGTSVVLRSSARALLHLIPYQKLVLQDCLQGEVIEKPLANHFFYILATDTQKTHKY